MFAHAIENDTCMEGSTLNGCKQLVLCRVLQVPAESHSAEIRIDQHRAIAIVPRHSQETGLTRMIVLESFAERLDRSIGATRNRAEDISRRGEPRLNAGVLWMHTARNNSADAGNQLGLGSIGNNAGRRSHDVDHVAFLRARADSIPMGVEGSNRNWNSCTQSKFLRPLGR